MNQSIKNVTSPRITDDAFTSLTKLKLSEAKRIAQKQKSQRSMLRRIGVTQNPYDSQRGPSSNQSS